MGQPLTEARADPTVRSDAPERGDWLDVLRVFLRLGLTAFGGPAAHTGLFRETLVRRRAWLDDTDFMDLVAATSVIPGPNSSELAMAIGRRRAGWPGFVAAGVGFILPAIVISVVLAWLAVGAATADVLAGVLIGIDPVIVAILVVSVAALASSMRGDPARLVLAAVAAAAYLADTPEVGILALGAAALAAWRAARARGLGSSGAASGPGGPDGDRGSSAVGAPAIGSLLMAKSALVTAIAAGSIGLLPIFLVFLKAGALLFGSGYVLVAILRADLVEGLGWITERQLLDAIAVGAATPGPLTSTAGYLGFLLAGVPGALAATAGMYLPALLLVALLEPTVAAVRRHATAAAALAGAGAAALGLMAGVTVELALATLLPGGGLALLPLAIAVASVAGLASGRVGPTVLILAGGLIGLVRIVGLG